MGLGGFTYIYEDGYMRQCIFEPHARLLITPCKDCTAPDNSLERKEKKESRLVL